MNTLREDLPKHIKDFFRKIQDYLDTDLYFYGSVTRHDYIPNKSDIDVAIFTDNEYSTISKLQHVLHVKRSAFDKIVWKLNGKMIYGYKIKCEKYTGINCEIAIYNDEFKQTLLDDYTKPIKNKSIIVFVLLFLLKLFYYQIPLLPTPTYVMLKRLVLNRIIDNKESVFFVLKPDDSLTN
jgi:predicted nucleotidyltransferase